MTQPNDISLASRKISLEKTSLLREVVRRKLPSVAEQYVIRKKHLDDEVALFRQVMVCPQLLEATIAAIEKLGPSVASYEKQVLIPYLRGQIKYYINEKE